MMKAKLETQITLALAQQSELPDFRRNLQGAFAIAVIETFGDHDYGAIPSDREVQESFDAPGAVVYHLLHEGKKVGGVVLRIDSETHRNSLDLFFVSPEQHNHGIGVAAWNSVEAQYPDTVAWETITPYFEKRNINFYVNKCGFHIVEFFNQHHSAPHMHRPEFENNLPLPEDVGFFRFEKIMKYGGNVYE